MQFLNIYIGLDAFNNDNFNEIPFIIKTKQTLLILKTEYRILILNLETIKNLNYLDKGRLNLIFDDENEKIASHKNELIQKIEIFIASFLIN